jgi:hypothetical protein
MVSTQAPLHGEPVGQTGPVTPLSPVLPVAPVTVIVPVPSTHPPSLFTLPAGQVHKPAWHRSVALQALPQRPQFCTSEVTSMQRLPHISFGAGQLAELLAAPPHATSRRRSGNGKRVCMKTYLVRISLAGPSTPRD